MRMPMPVSVSASVYLFLCDFESSLCLLALTIVRQLTRTNKVPATCASSYEFRNHEGVVVSKAKDELDKICRFYSLDVANPCMIMTQEYSKKFLQSEDAEARYEFFSKATRLTDVMSEFENAKGNQMNIGSLMNRNQARLAEQKKELDKKL